MALDDDVRILSGVGLFESFTQEQVRLLAFGAESATLASGEELFREGEHADCAYVVVGGKIGLYRERDGRRVAVGKVGSGALIGEYALIAETARLTGAVALADTDLIRLNRKPFRRILEEYPELAVALYNRVADDFAAMVSKIERMAPRFAS
ncbi:MAG: cyclic nucleotide-binding domain-containing protein [Rhizobiaceae bacterium]